MVSEPGSGQEEPEAREPVKKKRKTLKAPSTHEEPEVNKSTDSEADRENLVSSRSVARPSSGDRRSSAEAESRLDPGVDTEPGVPVQTSQARASKKKRQSSLLATIAMNGDSSSDNESGDDSGPEDKQNKKVRKLNSVVGGVQEINSVQETKKTLEKVATLPSPVPKAKVQQVVTPGSAKQPLKTGGEGEEFPRVGDLVWGRMSGFPFWPSFVTKSPQGNYKREMPSGKASYHVQFFNWNDESGWVNAVLEFDGLDSFKKIAAKKKSDKSYNPGKGNMTNKWEKAAREAEETMGLTRQERFEQYLVAYGAQNVRPPSGTPKPSPKHVVKTTPKPVKKPISSPASVKSMTSSDSKSRAITPVTSKRPREKLDDEEALPAGWKIKNREGTGSKEKTAQTFISPDGKEFKDKASALQSLSQEAALPVRYMKDASLPSGWRCQKIETSIYYFSPKGERFLSRELVASRLEEEGHSKEVVDRVREANFPPIRRRIGPRCAMKRWRAAGVLEGGSEGESSTSEDEDPGNILRLPNGMKFRKGGRMDEYLDLDKLFDPSNGGMIEMVQLPDIFLEHPTVSVTESDNEMVISDVDTGEFIAKKIIYD